MTRSPNKLIPDDFSAIPSLDAVPSVAVVSDFDEGALDAIGVLVSSDGDLPDGIDLDREAQKRAGFEAETGSTLVLPGGSGPLVVLVGVGASGDVDTTGLRDAAAAFVRATSRLPPINEPGIFRLR